MPLQCTLYVLRYKAAERRQAQAQEGLQPCHLAVRKATRKTSCNQPYTENI